MAELHVQLRGEFGDLKDLGRDFGDASHLQAPVLKFA
jgi:hypothetical protein